MKKFFEEGEEHYIWLFNETTEAMNLAVATLHACEKCGKAAHVNSVWIINATDRRQLTMMTDQANEIQECQLTIKELSATEDGDSYCEDCYYTNALKGA